LLAIDAGREAKFGGVGRYQISQNPGSAAPYYVYPTLEKKRNPGREGRMYYVLHTANYASIALAIYGAGHWCSPKYPGGAIRSIYKYLSRLST
jgi:hypothetical protein